jgi:hypothetical protein
LERFILERQFDGAWWSLISGEVGRRKILMFRGMWLFG